MNPIRVLHINAGSKIFGGVSAFCLNIYRNIDREKVQFDFLTPNISTYTDYKDEIASMGASIYDFGINSSSFKGKVKLWFALKEFLKSNHYDVVHINSGVLLFNCVVKNVCKKYSNARIFVHSHANGGRTTFKDNFSLIMKKYLVWHTDKLLACSRSAAEYMFPRPIVNSVRIINNGISVSEYLFNPTVREQKRKEMGLQGKYVIGHVGRFTQEKNHAFLIELFTKIRKIKPEAVLMLVGQGILQEEIKQKAHDAGVEDSVLFLGQQKKVNDLYQAMDIFVLPSIYEGFGFVNIEAQAAGLKCVVSDRVPESVNVTGNVVRLPLENSIEKWTDEIMHPIDNRTGYLECIKEAGFDIRDSAIVLEKMYSGKD